MLMRVMYIVMKQPSLLDIIRTVKNKFVELLKSLYYTY